MFLGVNNTGAQPEFLTFEKYWECDQRLARAGPNLPHFINYLYKVSRLHLLLI